MSYKILYLPTAEYVRAYYWSSDNSNLICSEKDLPEIYDHLMYANYNCTGPYKNSCPIPTQAIPRHLLELIEVIEDV